MGSWAELDANYPPGTLTPATALVVALGHLAGASSAAAGGGPTALLPAGISLTADLRSRSERYLAEVPLEQFLEQARALLSPRQRLIVALQLLDAQLAAGDPPWQRAMLSRLIAGLEVDSDTLSGHRATLALKNDLESFTQ